MEAQYPAWRSVEELPKNQQKVIAFYENESHGKPRTIMAQYLHRFSLECSCEHECNCEYSDHTDQYYYPEGWYEVVDNWDEWAFIPVSYGEVSHWMPLPNNPEEI